MYFFIFAEPKSKAYSFTNLRVVVLVPEVGGDEGDRVQRLLRLHGQGNVTVRGRSVVESRRSLLGVADPVSHATVLAAGRTVKTGSYRRDTDGRPNPGKVSAVRYRRSTSVSTTARSLTVPRSCRRRFFLLVKGRSGDGGLVPCSILLLTPSIIVPRPLHQNDARQIVEKKDTDPAGHPVRPGRAKKPVDNDDREHDHDHVVDKRK